MELLNVQTRQRKAETGQATVEFALLLPLFVACVSVLIACIGIGLASLRLADSARIAARTASTSDNPTIAVQSLLQNQGIIHTESIDESGQLLTVTLKRNIRVPLLGIPIPKIAISAQSTVLLEGTPVLTD